MTDMLDAFEALQAARQNHRIMELSFPSGDGPPAVMLPNELDIDEGLSRRTPSRPPAALSVGGRSFFSRRPPSLTPVFISPSTVG